ncbi:insulinase family protein [Robinsoniella peoriensis]|uniref:insulinase family protein n=1 Tax=Robinsoniella peoriensis TaxID=180332 RepID=UPI0009F4614E|nr:insulinase family protein [Robinsoniella peoriensis]
MTEKNSNILEMTDPVSGFRVKEKSVIGQLGADITLFEHEKSGAQAACIKNDDPELGFSIIYRTPYVDETDTNHVFEHAILASSEKYPSKDIFFDMGNKSYNTFFNAFTYPTFTIYPVCSKSEDQLIKMMDVYLSCMVSPDILKNDNFFKREALRYELEDVDSPILMKGTVLSEDFGYLTDVESNADDNLIHALYPGLYASNCIGKAHLNYKGLTYEHTLQTYERFYSFSNSLIILYGDMDFKKVMDFIEKEYLSKSERKQIDLSQYTNEQVRPGYVEQIVDSPAYEEDNADHASIVDYSVDLSGCSWDDLIYWGFITDMMNNESFVWHDYAKKAGLHNSMTAFINVDTSFPYLVFRLLDADVMQKESFKDSINRALKDLSENGFRPEIYRACMKSRELAESLMREATAVAVDVSEEIATYWTSTGRIDYHSRYQDCFCRISRDKEQLILKRLVKEALVPKRSAFVVTIPKPGLAEQMEQERDDYLKKMKESMSVGQRQQLVEDTRKFREWNETEQSNSSFMIQPKELPDLEKATSYRKKKFGDMVSYTCAAPIDHAGSFRIYFDISSVPEEDFFYLALYELLLTELDTERYTADKQKNIAEEYLYDLSVHELYPGAEAGENSRPMLVVSWEGLTEDYGTALDFLLEVMSNIKFHQREEMIRVLNKSLPDYDLSRTDDPMTLAEDLALGYIRNSARFYNAVNGQDLYRFLKKILQKLEQDADYLSSVVVKLEEIKKSVMHREKIIIASAAASKALSKIEKTAVDKLSQLPVLKKKMLNYGDFMDAKRKKGICVESSNQYSAAVGDFRGDKNFKGRYLPYLMAAKDKYIIPQIRFRSDAYSAGVTVGDPTDGTFCLYSYGDPNVKSTLDIFAGTADFLKRMEITKEELDGYILNAYGLVTKPLGILDRRMWDMRLAISGADPAVVNHMIEDIKNASLQDREAAANTIGNALKRGAVVTVGNESNIRAAGNVFDEIINYKE